MPGHRLGFTTAFGVEVEIAVGWSLKSKSVTTDQANPAAVSKWWWDARTRRPMPASVDPLAIECHARYSATLGYLMVVQVLWVPDTDLDIMRKNDFLVDDMSKFGDGYAAVDGGKVTPSRKFSAPDSPHPTYPFFAYNEVYYKPQAKKQQIRTFRHKDYAGAARSHSALMFDCLLVAKLKGHKNKFVVLDAFMWGMDLYKEAMLKRKEGVSDLIKAALTNEYPRFEWVSSQDLAATDIDSTYTPFEHGSTGKKERVNVFI